MRARDDSGVPYMSGATTAADDDNGDDDDEEVVVQDGALHKSS